MKVRLGVGLLMLGSVLWHATPASAQLRTEIFQNRQVVAQEIIVRFRSAAASRDPDIIATSTVGRTGAVRLRSRARNVAALIKEYSARPDVEYAEPNYVWKAADLPSDSFFNQQWSLQNTGQLLSQTGTAGADVKAVSAWDVAEGSRGIVVGMVDSGIDYNHPDLAPNIWSAPTSFSVTISGQTIQCAAGTHGFNAITRNCDPTDDDGHGTHTAGIVGAAGNNGAGVSGISRVSSLLGLKFLDPTGQGTTANAIAAIEFAVQVKHHFPIEANIRVLNASWGGIGFSQALLDEINLAGTNDILFVTSAGNLGRDNDETPVYPAAYNAANLISVAATDNRDQLAAFSNFGAASVHLGAPGVDIFSTLLLRSYGRETGTSASSALVSGAAALVASACGLDTSGLKNTLLSSVDSVPSMSGVTVTGGRLNVDRAIRNCIGTLPPTFTLAVTPAAQTIAFGTGAQLNATVTALNGFSDTVALSATDVPQGMIVDFQPQNVGPGISIVTVGLGSAMPDGTYFVGITAVGGGVIRTAGIAVTVGLPSGCSINTGVGTTSGRLDATDAASLHRPPAFADFCTVTLDSDRAVTIEMTSSSVDTFVYLLSDTGAVIASDDNGGVGTNSRMQLELIAGSYTVEATSASPGQTGNYSLSVKSTHPTLTSISPNSGQVGSTVNVTLTGSVFFGSPFLVKIYNCVGVAVSNITVISSTTATATLTLPNSVDTCGISVSNPGGTSTQILTFRILPLPPTITSVSPNAGIEGQIIPITITGTNLTGGVVSVVGGGVSVSTKTVTSTSINATVNTLALDPGVLSLVVTTAGGISNPLTFTVLLAPPRLTRIFPPAGGPGLTVDVVLNGDHFAVPFQINTDTNITVTNASVINPGRIEARFAISPSAPFGDYPVTLTTSAGTSQAITFSLLPPPVITSILPDRAYLGQNAIVVVTGTNFVCDLVASIDGTGVHLGDVAGAPCSSPTQKSILMQVSNTAPVGPRNLIVTGPNGVSNSVTFNILRPPPVIATLTPRLGAQASSVPISIIGANLTSGVLEVSGAGVQVSNVTSTASTLTATFSIDANATIGPRDVTITTIDGTSTPVTFTVTPPTWPDLTVTQTLPPKTASGYNEPFTITVRNDGEKQTVHPVTVTNSWTLPPATSISSSPGWSCFIGGSVVSCTTLNAIQPHAESKLILTLGMPLVAGFFENTVSVASIEDYNPFNNIIGPIREEILEVPIPKLVLLPGAAMKPGEQGTMSLSLSTPFIHDITGALNTVSLSFTPSVPGTSMDPATQFATGGQQVTYIIRANTLQAEFQGIPGPLGFQAGSVAGGLQFTVTSKPGNNLTRTITSTVSILAAAPAISAATSEANSTGFITSIVMSTSTTEVRTLSFQFNTATPIQLSCGGIANCSASGSTITFNVSTLFASWYANSRSPIATIRVPFSFQGTLTGTVSVNLVNTLGASNTRNFPLP